MSSITNIGQELWAIVRSAVITNYGNARWIGQERSLADVLDALQTRSVAQSCDLKVDGLSFRVWLARTGLADGEPFERTVYLEEYNDEEGRWVDVGYFDGNENFAGLGEP